MLIENNTKQQCGNKVLQHANFTHRLIAAIYMITRFIHLLYQAYTNYQNVCVYIYKKQAIYTQQAKGRNGVWLMKYLHSV